MECLRRLYNTSMIPSNGTNGQDNPLRQSPPLKECCRRRDRVLCVRPDHSPADLCFPDDSKSEVLKLAVLWQWNTEFSSVTSYTFYRLVFCLFLSSFLHALWISRTTATNTSKNFTKTSFSPASCLVVYTDSSEHLISSIINSDLS